MLLPTVLTVTIKTLIPLPTVLTVTIEILIHQQTALNVFLVSSKRETVVLKWWKNTEEVMSMETSTADLIGEVYK